MGSVGFVGSVGFPGSVGSGSSGSGVGFGSTGLGTVGSPGSPGMGMMMIPPLLSVVVVPGTVVGLPDVSCERKRSANTLYTPRGPRSGVVRSPLLTTVVTIGISVSSPFELVVTTTGNYRRPVSECRQRE